jgi:L-alanine-DL-glutamate epimerase-like enolase superfamily enzyme
MVTADSGPAAVGGPVAPAAAWDRMRHQLREAGGGITTLAMAAVDIGLWDRQARLAGQSLVSLIGRQRDQVPVYASGVNRHLTLDELSEQVSRWVAAGHSRYKIKVGGRDLEEDVARVAAVRALIGPGALLMVDANQLWDLPTARRAAAAMEPYRIHWLEEPLPAEDYGAYARLRAAISIPVAAGESLYTEAQFRDLLLAGAVDFVQPNACRVGGITPFLRIAHLARLFSVPVMPHLLPDLSGQLALCLPLPAMVEDIDQGSFAALGALSQPSGVTIEAGQLRADTGPGHGLTFATGMMRELPG